jgi:uncharacterized protein
LGPAIAFLLSAPALDIVPVILTFRLLGTDIGWARLIGIAVFAVFIGLIVEKVFKEKQGVSLTSIAVLSEVEVGKRWWVQLTFFSLLVAIMILVTDKRWAISGVLAMVLVIVFLLGYTKEEFKTWMGATYQFVRFILPWFLIGAIGATLVAVFVPNGLISQIAGGNSLISCLITSVFGSVMYLCPPSEVLFTRAFMDLGMGKGPALSFLLTSPAVSLPSFIVLVKIIGWKKTLTYISLLIILATIAGYIFGQLAV